MIGNLQTDRLIMRPMVVEDAPAYYEFYKDPEVMRFIGKGDIVESVEKVQASIEKHQKTHYLEHDFGLWSVFLPKKDSGSGVESDTLIGHCGVLFWEIDGVRDYEIAYLLGKQYWGNGYATEAACATRDWGFSQRNFARMISLIYADNVSSQMVAQRVGMSYLQDVIVMEDVKVRQYALQNPNKSTTTKSASE